MQPFLFWDILVPHKHFKPSEVVVQAQLKPSAIRVEHVVDGLLATTLTLGWNHRRFAIEQVVDV